MKHALRFSMVVTAVLAAILLAAQTAFVPPEGFYTYVGALDTHSVTLAWGTRDDIGRSAKSEFPVTLEIGELTLPTSSSWIRVEGLEADREYAYTLRRQNAVLAQGTVRTWPEQADSLVFFVIGDFGNGTGNQRAIAGRMEQERQRLEAEGKHVRFVLTTGDNLYARLFLFHTGADDPDWQSRFFEPYRETLMSIPFYPTLGNHDGNQSERRGDLPQYLDNFFFPVPEPSRWYSFEFGGLAQFYGLDTTKNTLTGPEAPAFAPGGEQSRWLEQELAKPALPWRIPYMHHPFFSAGPEHDAALRDLMHWFELFQKSGVEVAFGGHEHNFQLSERSPRTGNIQFVVSGAGGQLRDENVRKNMEASAIAAWAPVRHFLVVELTRDEMRITLLGDGPVSPVNSAGSPISLPIRVPRVLN